jgi:EmrB/QacA subfamily drug resistance transporter
MNGYTIEQKTTILVVVITAFVTTFSGSALNLAIPNMCKEFDVSASTLGWIVTGYMLVLAAFAVPFGRLADITRKKSVFVPGLMTFSIASFASAFVWNFAAMLVCRVVTAIGGAMIFSTSTAILVSAFPGSDRGKVLGFAVASTYIGLSTGPVVGGLMNHYFGWRSIFMLAFLVGMIIFLIALIKLPAGEKNRYKMSLDMPGNILYIAMVLAIMYGFTTIADSKAAVGLIAAGAALLFLFIRHELKAENPVIKMELFTRNLNYSFSNIAALLNYGASGAIGYLLSVFLQVVKGYSSQTAGFIMISQPVFMALLSPYAGKLSDRISPYKLASIGMGLCAIGIAFFIFINISYPLWLIMLALIITGVGFALFSSPNSNAIMSSVESKDYGIASSLQATMRSLGHTSSMAVVTVTVSIYMGNSSFTSTAPGVIVKTMSTSFLIFFIMCAVGIFFSAKRKKGGSSV